MTKSNLPSFRKPPIIELALGVQFEALPKLKALHIGEWWAERQTRFPKTEEYPPLPEMVESFEIVNPQKLEIRFVSTPSKARHWFLNEQGTELIQLQDNRFVYNWRKIDDKDEYPRYTAIRKKFEIELKSFCDFLKRTSLGEFVPNLCEVTYVSHIISGEGWDRHGQMGNVFSISPVTKNPFLPEPEVIGINTSYLFKDSSQKPLGRLIANISSEFRITDKKPVFVVNLSARGLTQGKSIEEVLKFLDLGHEWDVKGFASITKPEMHSIWGREQ